MKLSDWLWYNEQFRFIRQSDPQKFPWDQIHWELWLRVSTTFRRQQPFTNQPHTQHDFVPFFPRVLAGHFRGENTALSVNSYMSVRCGAKHAGSQCSVQTRFGGFASKGKGSPTQVAGTLQPPGNPGKGRSA